METLTTYLDNLASERPVPGGGSAAALTAASAAALIAMVARITLAAPRHAERHDAAREIVAQADELRALSLAARLADERAYGAVAEAMRLPRVDAERKAARTAALQAALAGAAEAPLETAILAARVLALAERALALDNPELVSDLGCAGELASAALSSAAFNVRVNHRYMKDEITIRRQAGALHAREAEAPPTLGRIRTAVSHLLSASRP